MCNIRTMTSEQCFKLLHEYQWTITLYTAHCPCDNILFSGVLLTWLNNIYSFLKMSSKVCYNYLGKSGLKVSNICMGTMTFGDRKVITILYTVKNNILTSMIY